MSCLFGRYSLIPGFLYGLYNDSLNDYDTIRARIFNGELKQLQSIDRAHLLDFIYKVKIVHSALQKDDLDFIILLADNGFDFKNSTLLSDKDVEATGLQSIEWLSRNVLLSDPDFDTLFRSCFYNRGRKLGTQQWKEILIHCLKMAPVNVFNTYGGIYEVPEKLIEIAKENSELEDSLLKQFAAWNDRAKMSRLINKDLAYFATTGLKTFTVEGILQDDFNDLLRLNDADVRIVKRYFPRSELDVLFTEAGNFQSALICFRLLHCKSLKDINLLLNALPTGMRSFYGTLAFISKKLQFRCKEHIQSLQRESGQTIWEFIPAPNDWLFKVHVDIVQGWGCDPAWVNQKNENIVFIAHIVPHLSAFNYLDINFAQINTDGLNALEYHCTRSARYIERDVLQCLCDKGLRLTPNSSYYENYLTAQELHPGSPYFQMLVTLYLSLPLNELRSLLRGCDNSTRCKLKKCMEDSGLARSGIFIESKSQEPSPPSRKVNHIEDLLHNREGTHFIPQSQKASHLINALIIQHHSRAEDCDLIPIEELFADFHHNDIIHFTHYLFHNLDIMHLFFQDYMTVSEVNVFPRGSTKSTFGTVIHAMLRKMENFKHLPKTTDDLDRSAQKLVKAFQKSRAPIPIQTLEIPKDRPITLLNRTVFVYNGEDQCDAYKFLKPNEDYRYFSQERSVTKSLRKMEHLFESHFHEPVNLYTLRELPEELKQHQEKLPPGPSYVYHYRADPGITDYLQSLPKEAYDRGRGISLRDAATLNKLGISPDLASMFHNEEQKRMYVLLIDLLILQKTFHAEGGAGRLDQAFFKVKYPNMRATGLTDMRDAKVSFSNDWINASRELANLSTAFPPIRGLYALLGLSNAFLVDMLIQVDRYKQEERLDWNNEAFLNEFAEELSKGFILLASTYSKQSEEAWQKCAAHCGIDWKLMAQQIAFWTDNSPSGYPSYVAAKKIPDTLYQKDVKVTINPEHSANFDDAKGFITEGKQDIGIFNGPLALTEFEKAAYTLFFAIILAEHNFGPLYEQGRNEHRLKH